MRAALVIALALICQTVCLDALADEPPRKGFRITTTTYRGNLKDGRDKAKRIGGGGSTSVGGRLGMGGGSSLHGRGTRKVISLVEDDAAKRQADIALGVERKPETPTQQPDARRSLFVGTGWHSRRWSSRSSNARSYRTRERRRSRTADR